MKHFQEVSQSDVHCRSDLDTPNSIPNTVIGDGLGWGGIRGRGR